MVALLPAGTHLIRLMAWQTGTSLIDGNGFLPLRDELLLDWMDRNHVRWRVGYLGDLLLAVAG